MLLLQKCFTNTSYSNQWVKELRFVRCSRFVGSSSSSFRRIARGQRPQGPAPYFFLRDNGEVQRAGLADCGCDRLSR
jgi:hypothetical protein